MTKSIAKRAQMNQRRYVILFIIVAFASIAIASGLVYFWQNKKIKTLKEQATSQQAQIISLESKAGRSENQAEFLKIDENKYVGEAQVFGKYYLSGATPDVCFSPDKASLALLPESDVVQVFCFKAQNAKESEDLIKAFYSISRDEALRNFKKYGTIEAARQATVQISDYEIKVFSEQSKTGYTTLVKILKNE